MTDKVLVRLTANYDHPTKTRKDGLARSVKAFKKDGGANRDGIYEVTPAVRDAIVAAGKGEAADAAAAADTTGSTGDTTTSATTIAAGAGGAGGGKAKA